MKLFEEFKIKNLIVKNRIILSPMAMYSAKDGLANDFHLVHYGSRAVGGTGIIMIEATAIEKIGRITPSDLCLYNEKQMRAFSKIVKFIKEFHAIPGIELSHAGRKAGTYVPWEGFGKIPFEKGGWISVAPSSIPYISNWSPPKELSIEKIKKIQHKFVLSAILAIEAGFDIIELHGAHGYLIHEFLSPISNKRQDRYGGNLENRSRFLFELIEKIKEKIPEEIPLFVRISGVDFLENGWSLGDTLFLTKQLKSLGVDLIDCSSGGILPGIKIPEQIGYNVFISEAIKKQTNIKTSVVGYIFDPNFAEKIIEDKKTDMVTLGRVLLRDPYWPIKNALKYNKKLYPVQYERAFNVPKDMM